MSDKTLRIEDAEVKYESEKALLVDIDGDEHWIPKSQVHDDSEVYSKETSGDGALIISEWIAKQKGLL